MKDEAAALSTWNAAHVAHRPPVVIAGEKLVSYPQVLGFATPYSHNKMLLSWFRHFFTAWDGLPPTQLRLVFGQAKQVRLYAALPIEGASGTSRLEVRFFNAIKRLLLSLLP